MAIFHMNFQNISAGKMKSAVASASYRSGELLYSERENKVSQNPLKEKLAELKNLQKEVKQEENKLSEKIQGQLHNFVKQSPQAKVQEQNNQQEQSQEEDNGLHM